MSTRRSGGLGEWRTFVLAAVAIAAGSILVTGQVTVPNTFVNGTVADATQVNANFNALATGALNRTGGTMTGPLNAQSIIPTANNTYVLGSLALQWKLPFIAGGASGQFLQTDGAGTTSWASASSCAVYTAKTANYTAVANDLVAATSGTFTVTLPAAAANANKCVAVVNNGTGTITVGPTGADTVTLATSFTLNPATATTQGDSGTFWSDGTSNWNIF